MAYLAQPEQQQKLEWLDGGEFAVLLDSAATAGQLTVGRFSVRKGEAPPYHLHTREDEVFMLVKGTALVWCDDEERELAEGGSSSCRATSRTATGSPPTPPTC
jgi:mannose-6-phosphate isomerase-like protein (cupin superfamily)